MAFLVHLVEQHPRAIKRGELGNETVVRLKRYPTGVTGPLLGDSTASGGGHMAAASGGSAVSRVREMGMDPMLPRESLDLEPRNPQQYTGPIVTKVC